MTTDTAERLHALLSVELTGEDLDGLDDDELHTLRTLLDYWAGMADRHVRRRQQRRASP